MSQMIFKKIHKPELYIPSWSNVYIDTLLMFDDSNQQNKLIEILTDYESNFEKLSPLDRENEIKTFFLYINDCGFLEHMFIEYYECILTILKKYTKVLNTRKHVRIPQKHKSEKFNVYCYDNYEDKIYLVATYKANSYREVKQLTALKSLMYLIEVIQ